MTDAMDHPVIGTPEFDDARTDAMAVAHQVKGLVINDMDDYADASAMLTSASDRVKQLDALRLSMTRPLDESKRRIIAMFKPVKETLANTRTELQQSIVDYHAVEETKRATVAAKAREVAEAQRERLLAEAAEAEEKWDNTSAEHLLEAAAAVPEPVAQRAPYRKAAFVQERWRAEVTDLMALVRAVAAGTAPLTFLTADLVVLNREAVAQKSKLNYAGVRAVSKTTLGSRSQPDSSVGGDVVWRHGRAIRQRPPVEQHSPRPTWVDPLNAAMSQYGFGRDVVSEVVGADRPSPTADEVEQYIHDHEDGINTLIAACQLCASERAVAAAGEKIP